MTEKNVVFIFSGDNDDLESSVNEARDSIDGLKTSTKQASDGIKDGFGKAKKSADNLKKGTADAAKSTAEMKTKVSEAQEALGAMGAAISVVNPELGMMVQQSSALVGGVKGLVTVATLLGSSLGAVSIALAAVAAVAATLGNAWSKARDTANSLDASIKAVQASLSPKRILETAAAWRQFNGTIASLDDQLLILNGTYDAIDATLAANIATIREQSRARLLDVAAGYAQLEMERQLQQQKLASGELSVKEQIAAQERIDAIQAELPLAKERIDAVKHEIQLGIEEAKLLAERTRQRQMETEAQRESTSARVESTDAAVEEEKVKAEATEKEKRRLSDLGAAMEAISAMEHDATQSTLEGIDLIESKRDDALDALRDRYIEARALTIEDYDGRLEATVAYREAKKAIEDEFDELRTEKEQELSGQRAELQAREIQNSITAAQITADAIGSIADDMFSRRKSNLDSLREYRAKHGQDMSKAEKKRLNKEIKEEKKAMRKIAVAQKAAALIDVAIKTVQGIMSVWATFAAAPPVAAALSAVIGAVGIASGVAIASQAVEFHRGGVVDAKLLDGESVLNRQATQALGNEGVDALNRAGSTSPAAMASSVTLIIGRREAREIVRTDVRSGGLITQEIGRIANTYGNVGLSGLPVLA